MHAAQTCTKPQFAPNRKLPLTVARDVLFLNLKGEYFRAIADGTKVEEYRLVTPYWEKRLLGKTYSSIVIRHGYPSRNDVNCNLLRPWRGLSIKTICHPHFGSEPVRVFAIVVNEVPSDV